MSLHAVCGPEISLVVRIHLPRSVLALLCRFPGGLKERTARDQFRLQPEEILRRAVYGMLPKNKLRKVGRHHCAVAQAMYTVMQLGWLLRRDEGCSLSPFTLGAAASSMDCRPSHPTLTLLAACRRGPAN